MESKFICFGGFVHALAIPVTGREGFEKLRVPHCLYNRLRDGSKVVSPTNQPRSTPQKHNFSASGTHFC
jgi:hypothetical protein